MLCSRSTPKKKLQLKTIMKLLLLSAVIIYTALWSPTGATNQSPELCAAGEPVAPVSAASQILSSPHIASMKAFLARIKASFIANIKASFPFFSENLQDQWSDFKNKHKRVYDSAEDDARRFLVFQDNAKFVREENVKGHSFKLDMNKFGDVNWTEFVSIPLVGGFHEKTAHIGAARNTNCNLSHDWHAWNNESKQPQKVDWVARGKVSSVKDQSTCNSCWSFSVVGAIESAVMIAQKSRGVDFSAQQLVDCYKQPDGKDSCTSGPLIEAFEWVRCNGLSNSKDYKYVNKTGKCLDRKRSLPALGLSMRMQVGDKTTDLISALVQQPVSVAIQISGKKLFRFYSKNIISYFECEDTSMDHAALAVGYGVLNGVSYWNLKNSWGTDWGQRGYFLVKRSGRCLELKMAMYPIVKVSRV